MTDLSTPPDGPERQQMIHIKRPSGGEIPDPRHRHNDSQTALLGEGGVWCTIGDCEWSATGGIDADLIQALIDHYAEEHLRKPTNSG